jgi:high-affinity iron transporter
MFNFTAAPTVLEVIAWVAYAVVVMVLFLGPTVLRRLRPPTPTSAPVETAVSTH